MTDARRILAEVSLIRGVPVERMRGRWSTPEEVRARWEAMWRMRHEKKMSLPKIGRELGGLHHTTVLHGLRRFEEMLDTEEGLAERLALPVAA